MQEGRDFIEIAFKDKIINLHFDKFDDDIDVDLLTKIDYTNLYAEIITIPALMNRVGIWKGEAENRHADSKLDLEIMKAKKSQYYRKSLTKKDTYANGNPKIKYPSNDEVDESVTLDDEVQALARDVLDLKRDESFADALYWSIKSKEKKLDRISNSMSLVPEDFEKNVVEGKWNCILISAKKKLIEG